jgi:hypothetical protein
MAAIQSASSVSGRHVTSIVDTKLASAGSQSWVNWGFDLLRSLPCPRPAEELPIVGAQLPPPMTDVQRNTPAATAKLNSTWVLSQTVDRIKIEGQVPKGGTVVVSAHPSLIEGPLAATLGFNLLAVKRTDRLQPFVEASGAIQVDPTQPGGTVAKGVEVLRAGKSLWLSPAGGRHLQPLQESEDGRGQPVRTGAAVMAMLSGKSIVPMGLNRYDTSQVEGNIKAQVLRVGALALGTTALGLAWLGSPLLAAAAATFAGFSYGAAWAKHKPVTLHVRFGEPVKLEQADSVDKKAFAAAAERNSYEVARSINALSEEMNLEHLAKLDARRWHALPPKNQPGNSRRLAKADNVSPQDEKVSARFTVLKACGYSTREIELYAKKFDNKANLTAAQHVEGRHIVEVSYTIPQKFWSKKGRITLPAPQTSSLKRAS